MKHFHIFMELSKYKWTESAVNYINELVCTLIYESGRPVARRQSFQLIKIEGCVILSRNTKLLELRERGRVMSDQIRTKDCNPGEFPSSQSIQQASAECAKETRNPVFCDGCVFSTFVW